MYVSTLVIAYLAGVSSGLLLAQMSSFKSEAQRCDKFLQCGFMTSHDVVIL